jgi:hypothetical protein
LTRMDMIQQQQMAAGQQQRLDSRRSRRLAHGAGGVR